MGCCVAYLQEGYTGQTQHKDQVSLVHLPRPPTTFHTHGLPVHIFMFAKRHFMLPPGPGCKVLERVSCFSTECVSQTLLKVGHFLMATIAHNNHKENLSILICAFLPPPNTAKQRVFVKTNYSLIHPLPGMSNESKYSNKYVT